jgi:hypothetical protein
MQKGAALLLFMLLLVLASSYSLVRNLNVVAKPHTRELVTSKTLAEAKQVLLGYALTYPENNAGFGPGYLPCPDRNNDGFINAGTCASSTATTIGRFPWRSLGVREMLDSSGARLWYVLSDNYRNNPKINNSGGFMNSDNAGQLTLDSVGDIVALIIAPGEPVGNQNRDISEFDIPDEIAHYLEGENADIATPLNVDFVASNAGDFNDKVIAITRQELMSMVEKRVLAEVEDRIIDYQDDYDAFPWLSPFVDPSTSIYRGALNTWQGHLPFHWSTDPDSITVGTGSNIAGRNPFQSTVGWIWHTDPGTATTSNFPWGSLSPDCLRNVDCIDPLYPQITQVTTPAVDCTWTVKDTVNCASAGWVLMSSVACNLGCGIGTCTREYNVNIPEYTGTSIIIKPTNLVTRTRNVSLNDLPVQNIAVDIRDISSEGSTGFCGAPITTGGGSINFVAGTTGSFAATGIQYDIDVDDSELPQWFVDNEWQNLIYLTYANGEPLPGDTTAGQDCTTLTTQCLTVDINGTDTTNVRAAAFSAGVDLTPLTTRPNATLSDYFDDDNNDLDSVFDKKRITTTYNDQSRIISTAP